MDPYSSDIQYHQNQLPQNNQHYPHQFQNIPTVEGSSDPLQQQLRSIPESHCRESEQAVDFKSHSLPLARIKKIMKSDEHVRMISAEAPVLLAKACEMFIQDVTHRSWNCTEESKRRTMQKGDISAALSTSELFDFLVDIVPREKRIAPTMQPVMPFMLTSLYNNEQQQQQQHNYSLGEDAGLSMGLPIQLLQNDNADQGYNANCIQGTWPGLSKHSTWPPNH